MTAPFKLDRFVRTPLRRTHRTDSTTPAKISDPELRGKHSGPVRKALIRGDTDTRIPPACRPPEKHDGHQSRNRMSTMGTSLGARRSRLGAERMFCTPAQQSLL